MTGSDNTTREESVMGSGCDSVETPTKFDAQALQSAIDGYFARRLATMQKYEALDAREEEMEDS